MYYTETLNRSQPQFAEVRCHLPDVGLLFPASRQTLQASNKHGDENINSVTWYLKMFATAEVATESLQIFFLGTTFVNVL